MEQASDDSRELEMNVEQASSCPTQQGRMIIIYFGYVLILYNDY